MCRVLLLTNLIITSYKLYYGCFHTLHVLRKEHKVDKLGVQ
jgi:hypothetical protein